MKLAKPPAPLVTFSVSDPLDASNVPALLKPATLKVSPLPMIRPALTMLLPLLIVPLPWIS